VSEEGDWFASEKKPRTESIGLIQGVKLTTLCPKFEFIQIERETMDPETTHLPVGLLNELVNVNAAIRKECERGKKIHG